MDCKNVQDSKMVAQVDTFHIFLTNKMHTFYYTIQLLSK